MEAMYIIQQNVFLKQAKSNHMKRAIITWVVVLLTININSSWAQSALQYYKGGHTFDIGLPAYMSRTMGLNSAASIQYKSVVKDVYGFVICDTKEDLSLAEMKFSSINEFYEDFINSFLTQEENRNVSKPVQQKKGDIHFIESDVVYFDKDAKTDIYYLVGIVETKKAFYKVLSWAVAENKDKFKADFQKILYSLKD